jgi:tetratricopeptide (TPR) repeat protein
MYEFLQSPQGGGFRDEKEGGRLILLTNEEATRANVESALAKLKRSKPNDYFVIFIAAHGMVAPRIDRASNQTTENSYFALYDTDLSNIEGTSIRMDYFKDLINEVPARKGVVLADTCHSAGVQMEGRSTGSSLRANASFITKMNESPEGIGFIWAASQTEAALEPENLGHGYFTYCLLEGLRGNADSDKNERVSFGELAKYVTNEVSLLTENRQNPYYSVNKKDAIDLPLAVVPYASDDGDTSRYGTLVIRTPDLDGVEVAIDGAPIDQSVSSRLQRIVRVKAGARNLSFSKGAMKAEVQATVEPNRSKFVEVNLTFSKSDSAEDSLLDAPKGVLNAYFSEGEEPGKEAKELFLKGIDSFKRQKFQEAVGHFNAAIKANNGGYADAYVFMGQALQSLDRSEEAVKSFERALALRPSDYETEILLAEAQFGAGTYNVEDIADRLQQIKYRHPNNDHVRVVYADVLMSRRMYWAAERELREAIRIRPTSPPAHMILAQAITEQRQKVKQKQAVEEAQLAIKLYQELSRKQTSFSKGLKRLSISHVIFGGGKYIDYAGTSDATRILAEACIWLTQLDETLPDRSAYLDLAQQSIEESIRIARKYNDKSRLAYAMEVGAQVYVRKLDLAQAVKLAEEALKLSEMDDMKAHAHYTLYEVYMSMQKYAKAEESLKGYLTLRSAQLSARDRQEIEAELARVRRLKEINRQD